MQQMSVVHVITFVIVYQVGLLDLEVNTLSKILCMMVVLLALVMMIIKVHLSLVWLLMLLHKKE